MREKQPKKKNNTIIKIMIILIAIIASIVLILSTMSRYESEAETVGEIDIAMYILKADYQTMNIKLDNMIPREEPYTYTFSIANYDEDIRTDIRLEYTLKIRTTTNLPLIYHLYMNEEYDDTGAEDIIETSQEIIVDDDGTYFRMIETDPIIYGYEQDEINIYQLVIEFPETYKSIEYQDVIEGIEIIISSTQIL